MAIAPGWKRVIAALLDFTLLGVFAFVLLTRLLWLQEYPHEYAALTNWLEENLTAAEDAAQAGQPTPEPTQLPIAEQQLAEMFAYGFGVLSLATWVYFFSCEWLGRGISLGKSALGLRVISLRHGGPPTLPEVILRSSVKAFACLQPMLLIPLDLLVLAVNRQRRAGHDLAASTIVVGGPVFSATPTAPTGTPKP